GIFRQDWPSRPPMRAEGPAEFSSHRSRSEAMTATPEQIAEFANAFVAGEKGAKLPTSEQGQVSPQPQSSPNVGPPDLAGVDNTDTSEAFPHGGSLPNVPNPSEAVEFDK